MTGMVDCGGQAKHQKVQDTVQLPDQPWLHAGQVGRGGPVCDMWLGD
jgi:hypothetical protein